MANNLHEIRKSRGMTQAELARETGINRVTIARYELGLINPGSENLIKLMAALRCSADELLQKKAG